MKLAVIILAIAFALLLVWTIISSHRKEIFWHSKYANLEARAKKAEAHLIEVKKHSHVLGKAVDAWSIHSKEQENLVDALTVQMKHMGHRNRQLEGKLHTILKSVKPFITRYGEGFAMGNRQTVETMDKLRSAFPDSLELQEMALEGYAELKGDSDQETPIYNLTKSPMKMTLGRLTPHKG